MLPESVTLRAYFSAAVLLFFVVFLVYANAFWGVFQFDDYNVIVNNPRVHSWPAWWHDLRHGIRPLLKFTYTADWTIGWGVAGFHFTNIFIHLCNTWLVWLLSRQLLARFVALAAKPSLPLFVAILFAVHPVHSEAITYICGRSIALMTLFYLLGLLFYVVGRLQQHKYYLHLLVPLCMLLALGSKETAITFPAALLLWELYSGGTIKEAIKKQWSSWLLLLVCALYFIQHQGYVALAENSAGLNSVTGNAATQTLAISYLLQQWLLPLWLNIDPDLHVARDFSGLTVQVMVLVIAITVMLLTVRRRPWLSFGLAWCLLQLFPLYLLLPRIDVANDRQLYLVTWPLALALVIELSLWLKAEMFKLSLVIIAFVLASLLVLRNQVYQSEIALWEATVQLSPNKARVQNNLGYAYLLGGKKEEARLAFNKALSLDPSYCQARFNLLSVNE